MTDGGFVMADGDNRIQLRAATPEQGDRGGRGDILSLTGSHSMSCNHSKDYGI